ncbi:neprilysin-11-like protein, partial [Dinothrombium tinctorium]
FRDEFGLLELRRILEKAGGFPMISKHWDKDEYNWVDAYIYTDIKIRDSRKTFLTETDKNDWRYRKEEDTLRNKIKQRIKRLKTDHTDEELDKDIDDLFALERSILNLKKDGYFYEGPDEINTTLEELEEEYPNVPWLKIISNAFRTVDIDIYKNETVILKNPYYLQRIGELINNQTKRTLANYIGWKIIYKFGAKAIYEFQKQDIEKT